MRRKFIFLILSSCMFRVHKLSHRVHCVVHKNSIHFIMISIALSIFLIFIGFSSWLRNVRSTPPGPWRIPLLGSMLSITLKKGILDWTFDKEVIKHQIVTLSFGRKNFFIINDFLLAKVSKLYIVHT